MIREELIYKTVGDLEIKMDIYRQADPTAPMMLYIHGGALIWGSRRDITSRHIQTFYDAGFTLCSMDYRLAPETKIDAIIQDVRDAITYLRHEAPDVSLSVVGGSAGGYLSLMCGTFSVRPDRIVSLYGYGDILAEWYNTPNEYYNSFHHVTEEEAMASVGDHEIAEGDRKRFNDYLRCRQQGNWVSHVAGENRSLEELRGFCPIHCIDADYPPTLLIHGDKDKDVPYEASVRMHDALVEHGVKSRLMTVEGQGHAFDYMEGDGVTYKVLSEVCVFCK